MEINKIEIQDSSGNIYYPKTSSDIVVYKQTQTTLTQKIDSVYTKTEIDNMLYPLLHPYRKPSISITQTGNTVYKIGTSNEVTFTIKVTKGRDNIRSIILKNNGTVVKTVNNPSSADLTQTLKLTLTGTTRVTAVVNDGTSDVTSEKTVTYVYESFYGLVASNISTPNSSQITALAAALNTSKSFTYNNINASSQKIVFAYPKSYGTLTKIIDGNNFDCTSSYNRSEVTINTVAYYCYTLANATTVSGAKQIYN